MMKNGNDKIQWWKCDDEKWWNVMIIKNNEMQMMINEE